MISAFNLCNNEENVLCLINAYGKYYCYVLIRISTCINIVQLPRIDTIYVYEIV